MTSVNNIKWVIWIRQRHAVVLKVLSIGLVASTAVYTMLWLPDHSATDSRLDVQASAYATTFPSAGNQGFHGLHNTGTFTDLPGVSDSITRWDSADRRAVYWGQDPAVHGLTYVEQLQEGSQRSLGTVLDIPTSQSSTVISLAPVMLAVRGNWYAWGFLMGGLLVTAALIPYLLL